MQKPRELPEDIYIRFKALREKQRLEALNYKHKPSYPGLWHGATDVDDPVTLSQSEINPPTPNAA